MNTNFQKICIQKCILKIIAIINNLIGFYETFCKQYSDQYVLCILNPVLTPIHIEWVGMKIV